MSFMMVPLQAFLKSQIFRGLFRTLSNTYDGVFPAKTVNVF